jgi:hypothetical protein
VTTIKIKNLKDFDGILRATKIAMFPGKVDEINATNAWNPIDGIMIDTITTGSWWSQSQRAKGISLSIRPIKVIRKVMIKDGALDIDKCLAKLNELKVLAEQGAEESKAIQQLQDALSAEVDQFIRSISGFPPGFVVRNHGEDRWTVKYEQTVSKDQLRQVVLAIKAAME